MDPDKLQEIATLDIGKEDDNPTSLAVGQAVGGYTFVYAGVNSNPKDAEKGNNEHFRMYALGKKKAGKTNIEEASRARLFTSTDKATYQRVLRLSRPGPNGSQLGAAATGFGEPNELVIFDSLTTPKSKGTRGILQLDQEAEDVDIIQIGPEEYMIAYCNASQIFLKTISNRTDTEDALCIYEVPGLSQGIKPLPAFRSIRFITPEFVAVLINNPQRGGALVRILRIMAGTDEPAARVAQTLALPRKGKNKVQQATGFAVANLNPAEVAGGKQGNTQFVLAIADQASISIAAMDYQVVGGTAIVTQPRLLICEKDVHPMQITGIAFQFVPPSLSKARMPQILRLASVSVGNTVVVQSIPIYRDKESPHYKVALQPYVEGIKGTGILATLSLIMVAALIQIILELAGRSPNLLNAEKNLPPIVVRFFSQDPVNQPWTPDQRAISTPSIPTLKEFAEHPIASILDSLRSESADGQHIIIRPSIPESTDEGVEEDRLASFNKDDTEQAKEAVEQDIHAKIHAHLHDEEVHGPAEGKTWERLGDEQKKAWLARMNEVEQWAGGLPPAIFKGVIFSEIAGAVGRGVAGM